MGRLGDDTICAASLERLGAVLFGVAACSSRRFLLCASSTAASDTALPANKIIAVRSVKGVLAVEKRGCRLWSPLGVEAAAVVAMFRAPRILGLHFKDLHRGRARVCLVPRAVRLVATVRVSNVLRRNSFGKEQCVAELGERSLNVSRRGG